MSAALHVFQEQHITRVISHPFCMRQYASFQDSENLYFLFDHMGGGDLMDCLSGDAKIRHIRLGSVPWGKKQKYLQVRAQVLPFSSLSVGLLGSSILRARSLWL